MTTLSQLDVWLHAGDEHERLEFKAARNQYDFGELCGYCTAIANEGGGHVILGVTDGRPRRVVGSAAFADVVLLVERLFQKLGFRVEVEAIAHPDGRVVVLNIPARPRGTAYHLDGRYLMRSGASLVPMSEDRLRSIFDEGKPDWGQATCREGLGEQEIVEFLETQGFFELIRTPLPTHRDGVIQRLIDERLVERTARGLVIRRIGALLLARMLADFPEVDRKAPRLIVYEGCDKLRTRVDEMMQGGLAVTFREFIRLVVSHLPRYQVIENGLRVDRTLVPESMVRELVANAIIHQDLTVAGARVMVEIYRDRVEISNPGVPVMPADRFIDGYQSRNEQMADLMRRMGICEEKGSGVDRVVDAAEGALLPAPDFRVGVQRTTAVAFGPRGFDQMDREERVRACYQHACLRWVTNRFMTNQSLRDRFGLPEAKTAIVSQVIAAAVDLGRIKADERVGTSRKLARYIPFWA